MPTVGIRSTSIVSRMLKNSRPALYSGLRVSLKTMMARMSATSDRPLRQRADAPRLLVEQGQAEVGDQRAEREAGAERDADQGHALGALLGRRAVGDDRGRGADARAGDAGARREREA